MCPDIADRKPKTLVFKQPVIGVEARATGSKNGRRPYPFALSTLVFGWRYAVGFVALLLIHEMGHFIAARQRGLPVGMPTFIPFMGAWIEMKAMPHDAETEAYVGLGGPLLGTIGALLGKTTDGVHAK